jgi:hypothetical protein
MINARGLARLGMLAVGLGIAAGWGQMPVAFADTASDPFSWPGDLAAPALTTTPSDLNLAVSFDGYNLIEDGTATATTSPGDVSFAIAYGDDAAANASNGFGGFASAVGYGSTAVMGEYAGYLNTAVANGTYSEANVSAGSLDSAVADGNNSDAFSGGSTEISGNDDVAEALGTNTAAIADGGSHDSAWAIDPTGTAGTGAYAYLGSGNFASALGDGDQARAGGDTVYTSGDNDIATVFGNDSLAFAGANESDPGNFDLGAVFDNSNVSQDAIGGDYLYDIVTALGNETGSAAATGGSNFLTDLLSLF